MSKTLNTALGALLIQLATTNHYWQLGKTIGFSSVIFNSLKADISSLSIVIGLALSSLFVDEILPGFKPEYPVSPLVARYGDYYIFALAGLLVGLGTKLGNGCTSGHMLCGLSRLRVRSLVATTVFVLSGFLTVYLTDNSFEATITLNTQPSYELYYFIAVNTILVYIVLPFISKQYQGKPLKVAHGLYSGFLFGLGLHIAGMTDIRNTIGFLSILTPQRFNPSLLIIFIFAIIPNMIIWSRIKAPLLEPKFSVANGNSISSKFILGNILFGAGWAILGVCPGPGLLNVVHFPALSIWLVGFLSGYGVAGNF